MILKYKDLIDTCYSDLKLFSINGQDKIINDILVQFIDNNKKNIVLQSPLGSGKSIIGAIVAQAFKYLFSEHLESNDDLLPASIVVHSNNLVRQYSDTFKDFTSKDFHQIIGASNYKCAAGNYLSEVKNPDYRGDSCFFKTADKDIQKDYCETCEYKLAKSHINKTNVLITNYSYHFISCMFTHHLKRRIITIFDEAHMINDVFCEHNAIYISVDRIQKYIDECQEHFPGELKDQILFFRNLKKLMNDDKINDSNYMRVIKSVASHYNKIAAVFSKYSPDDASDLDTTIKMSKISKKYQDLSCKIGDLITYEYDHVFECKDGDISIKSIFVSDMSKQIMSEYNLFMSATISDEFMIQTMNLPRDITAFIKVDPIYPAENKPVMFIGSHKLNYENMNNPNVIKELRENIYAILDQANEEKNKGIMFTSSFKLGEQLTDKFPKHTKLFLHKSGVDINKLINDFKSYQGSALLVSPSIYEGLSFDDDLSRFAILSKCPYPSLGEKRMKYISDNYPDIYKIITIKKIIQAIGRSVRNKDDHAITFVLDCNIEYLFNSQLNVWKNEFKII